MSGARYLGGDGFVLWLTEERNRFGGTFGNQVIITPDPTSFLGGALYPSKSGLMHKHIVKHTLNQEDFNGVVMIVFGGYIHLLTLNPKP